MQPRTVDLINLHDYPRSEYSAYWEIHVFVDDGMYGWRVRIYAYGTNAVLEETLGVEASRDAADAQAQKFVLDVMPKYRNPTGDSK